ncbi:hypothetical protein [Alteromonas sp. H39]|uniref:hypothetical protein n=1 Tax=Alteromonas sp. H39 TaxID=3389876 RepID=UPI0039E033C4
MAIPNDRNNVANMQRRALVVCVKNWLITVILRFLPMGCIRASSEKDLTELAFISKTNTILTVCIINHDPQRQCVAEHDCQRYARQGRAR